MKAGQAIKVGFCVAYDFELLRHSLPLVLPFADVVCLSIDKDRISWSGHPFSWDQPAFDALLNELDPQGRITLLEEDFHRPELSPMDNEVRQRNRMAAHMGDGGWHIQLDADEYFIDMSGFVRYLRQLRTDRPTNVYCPLLVLYKETAKGFLLVRSKGPESQDSVSVATNRPAYAHGRRNGDFNHYTNFLIIHQSWARPAAEIAEKISNWGHSTDFDTMAYLNAWNALDEHNHGEYRDLHPTKPAHWPSLELLEAKDVQAVIAHFARNTPVCYPEGFLRRKNSIWFSRLRKLRGMLGLSSGRP